MRAQGALDEFITNARTHASNGSNWWANRLLALFNKKALKKITRRLQEADPDRDNARRPAPPVEQRRVWRR
jgi:hypothetical protein